VSPARLALGGALALLASQVACRTTHGRPLDKVPAPALGDPAPRLDDDRAEQAYQDVLSQYSQRAEIYAGMVAGEDTRLFAAATYQSSPFREARLRRVGAFRAEPAVEIDQKLATERADAEKFEDFFLGVQVVDYRYDDFDRHNSIWRIALVSGGVELTPVSVLRTGRATLDVRALYPYMGEFWSGYRIRFKRVETRGAELTLRFASTIGKMEMSFPTQ
jgi:hypothetical protein